MQCISSIQTTYSRYKDIEPGNQTQDLDYYTDTDILTSHINILKLSQTFAYATDTTSGYITK
jgi:hypothetical protein